MGHIRGIGGIIPPDDHKKPTDTPSGKAEGYDRNKDALYGKLVDMMGEEQANMFWKFFQQSVQQECFKQIQKAAKRAEQAQKEMKNA